MKLTKSDSQKLILVGKCMLYHTKIFELKDAHYKYDGWTKILASTIE